MAIDVMNITTPSTPAHLSRAGRLLRAGFASVIMAMAAAIHSHAATVEYWNFEDGVNGRSFTTNGAPVGSGYSEGVNGTRMHGYSDVAGPSWTNATSPNGDILGMRSVYQDGYVFNAEYPSFVQWTAPNWTLELHVKMDDADGWETFVAKMGSSFAVSESDFYLQRKGIDSNELRLNYVPADTNNVGRIVLDGTNSLVAGQWYGLAVVANSSAGTITLYLDTGNGYALESQLTGLTGRNLGVKGSTFDWAFFRDYFGGGSDPTVGTMDNVRFSDSALTPAQLIPLAPPPIVLNTNDSGFGSLRHVIAYATNGSTITFTNTLSGSTILLTNGQIAVSKNFTIDASALAGGIQINGNHAGRIFTFNSNTTNVLTGLTLTNGYALSGSGGAIFLNINASLTIYNSTLSGNSAAVGGGGGIYNSYGTLTINNSTLSGNSAAVGGGGGIYTYGTLTLNNSTLAGNSANFGGAVYSYTTDVPSMTSFTALNQCTLVGNSANIGGGIHNLNGWTFMTNCTVTANTSPSGAGVQTYGDNVTETVVANSIIAGNNSGPDLSRDTTSNPQGFQSGGHNLIGTGAVTNFTSAGDVTNHTAGTIKLASLGNYGGPTQTMPPLPGSPAIDAGLNSATNSLTDQRGFARVVNSAVDIGAVESGQLIPGLDYALVNITNDVSNGDGVGGIDLRTALAFATNGSTITFATNLLGQTILLTNGQLTVDKNLTIDASALAGGIIIDGNNASRVFLINQGVTNEFVGLEITGGNGTGLVPSFPHPYGGGIFNQGVLTLNKCSVRTNSAVSAGGGAYNNGGELKLIDCTFAANSSGYGGAIQNEGILTAVNSTFSANQCTYQGGGISAPFNAPVALTQCTLSGNTAGDGGGAIGNQIAITNSIIAGNSAPTNSNLGGAFSFGGNNLTNGNPQLASLGNYGGPTPTLPPLPGSPAIDAGLDTGFLPALDQRGATRVANGVVDIGAVEIQPGIVLNNNNAGYGSLRDAVALASPETIITFDPLLSGQTIVLTSGEITVGKNLAIDASALPGGISINGNHAGRIFTFNSNTTNVLTGLTLTNGYASGNNGGAIWSSSSASLTLNNTTLAGNSAIFDGGGIYNDGMLTLNNSTLSGNVAISGSGGGIRNHGTTTINHSTLSGNVAISGSGGGIRNSGTLTINHSTFSGNSADIGGAVHSYTASVGSPLTTFTVLNQCTLAGNIATSLGGGVRNLNGWTFMTNCTVTANSALSGAGVWTYGDTNTETVVANSIIAGNTNGPDLGRNATSNPQAFLSGSHNLIGTGAVNDFTEPGDVTNHSAGTILLAALGNYGGPTETMPPLPGSPAIDAGLTSATNSLTDQRGFARVVAGAVDIGSVESGNAIPGLLVNTAADENDGLGINDVSLRDAIAFAPAGSTIIFAPALSGQTITLTNGELLVNRNLTIDGSALPLGMTVDGNNISRIFNLATNTTNILAGLTLTHGSSSGAGAAILINSNSSLILKNSTLAYNSTTSGGGGIHNSSGILAVENSTVVSNTAVFGGGIWSQDGQVQMNHSTVAHNTGTGGSGGLVLGNGSADLTNSIIAANSGTADPDVGGSGAALTATHCIIGQHPVYYYLAELPAGQPNAGGSYVGTPANPVNPLLAPLGNYGGPTPTLPPLPGSPAIDAGDDAAASGFTYDQRGIGYPRLVGAHVDIGAVEVQTIVSSTPVEITDVLRLGNGSIQFSFTNESGASFTVYASTNVVLPFPSWSNLGAPVESPAGTFQFTDPGATNFMQRYYRVESP